MLYEVITYPGQVTRIRAQFNTPGQFVWHCHIVEHVLAHELVEVVHPGAAAQALARGVSRRA